MSNKVIPPVEYRASGLTCSHCVASVTEEVSEIPGVTGVEVTLVKEGVSTVRVSSDREINPDAMRAAIAEAGYVLED
ncbi:heavy metal-associated domain-containing protein [Lysinibacter sp. HNR]|uniref:heavy-metal-associated domain-containing protein n=1 Tax=Lysinibacter sp. HNR TaxID=3031408 RepID=UPI002434EA8E|nr:heavy metal-associated domain-containing protein [Lysinibacter sp. HNR]WGD37242.1 heavy metal-associated domain-containing protein [Lysinibacter sp. HNR]